MTFITSAQLSKILPNNKDIEGWHTAILKILPKYNITTTNRAAAFLAQTAHESLDYTILSENLNYSATGLNKTFPKYFRNAGRDANLYARQPEKIANVVYANRMGNGSIESGDGWKFRGRGIIQLTGQSNYKKFADSIGKTIDETIQYVQTKEGAVESACWFWNINNLNSHADSGDIVRISKIINGGINGLDDRVSRFNKAVVILNSDEIVENNTNNTNIRPVIRLGSSGQAVTDLQKYLKIEVSGIFDKKTHDSLVLWQKFNGLTPDGIAGSNTYKKMGLT